MDVKEYRSQFNEEIEIAAKANVSNPQDEFLDKSREVVKSAHDTLDK